MNSQRISWNKDVAILKRWKGQWSYTMSSFTKSQIKYGLEISSVSVRNALMIALCQNQHAKGSAL